jgi:hypothetical protein
MTSAVPYRPHVARCTTVEPFGTGMHRQAWQCLLQDPHPGVDHDFGVDAMVFGRDLDKQPQVWLAAQLRDSTGRLRYQERQEVLLTSYVEQLAAWHLTGEPLTHAAGQWVRRTLPDVAAQLDAAGRWHAAPAERFL